MWPTTSRATRLLGLGVPPLTDWFWPAPTTNIAEAAALGDAARVRALAGAGMSLEAPQAVRQEIRHSEAPHVMTPLEAAVHHRSEYVVELLLDLGVHPPADEAHRLRCVARAVKAPQTAALIERRFQLPPAPCGADATAGAL